MSTDWNAWSREAVALMQRRNDETQDRYDLRGLRFGWDLDTATLRFYREKDDVACTLCVVGTVSAHEGTFMWAWANDTFPSMSIKGIERVRAFGEENGWPLLTTPEFPAGRPEGLDCVAISGRILDADMAFIHPTGDVTMFFTLSSFRVEPSTSADQRL